MVRRSGESSMTLQPTKDWRALEQIRWSKLERDNEMFKKIQRHRYMNIIRSIQLEKNIKIKHYERMEENLNSRMDRLSRVKQEYDIKDHCSRPADRKLTKSACPQQQTLPSLEELSPNSESSFLSFVSTGDQDQISAGGGSDKRTSKSGPPATAPSTKPTAADSKEDDGKDNVAGSKKPPSFTGLTIMVQNFLQPLQPIHTSMTGQEYRQRVAGLSKSTPGVSRNQSTTAASVQALSHNTKDNRSVFKHKAFYLTT